jgi:hypothetical protein
MSMIGRDLLSLLLKMETEKLGIFSIQTMDNTPTKLYSTCDPVVENIPHKNLGG